MDTYSKEYRMACEAREWLRRLERDPARIKAMLKRVADKRGQAAADELAAAMRKEWRK